MTIGRKRQIQASQSDRVFYAINTLLLLITFLIVAYPIYFVIIASVSNPLAVNSGQVILAPVGFTLDGYEKILAFDRIWLGYRNTIFYVILGTAIAVVLTVSLAYPLSRKDFRMRNPLMAMVAFTMFFGGGMIPTYLLVTNLGLYNSRWVMIIPSLLSTYNVMVCRSAFSGIPEEVIESAEIDGSNDFQTFFRIAVRLITPTLAVLTLYYAVAHWNDFFTALLYISDESLMPMQVLLRRVLIQSSSELIGNMVTDDKAAASIQIRYVTIVVATLPILVIYPLLQRYFVKGVMLGAVKG